jgi:hypothetical protein
LRAGGIDKHVEAGPLDHPFKALVGHLLALDREADLPTQVWVPDRYWGSLLEAGPYIEAGVLPPLPATGAVPWPWPAIAPAAFAGIADEGVGRRIMSTKEATVLGLSGNSGVVQRIYLRGPGGTTIYSFSLWPMLPDESS